MNKPMNYDSVQASGSYTPVQLGGHSCIIKQVSETKSKNGGDMVVVLFDFAQDDSQPNYFQAEFQANTKDQKKWPFNGSSWIMVNDYQDPSKTSRKFKTFCVNVEKSNPGFKIQWGVEPWGAQFKGKKIGAVYGNEEDEYNGEYRMRPALKWFCGIDQAKDAKVPEPKYLKNKPESGAPSAATQQMQQVEEEIPF